MELQSAEQGAREPVATSAIDGELTKHQEDEQSQNATDAAQPSEIEGGEHERGVDRRQHHDRHEEPEQELARGPQILDDVAGNLGMPPKKSTNIGDQPETVDAERDQHE